MPFTNSRPTKKLVITTVIALEFVMPRVEFSNQGTIFTQFDQFVRFATLAKKFRKAAKAELVALHTGRVYRARQNQSRK